MLNQLRVWLIVAVLTASSAVVRAQDWGVVANISATMGVTGNRLCYGEASRGDIGCPADAPTVSGSTITGTFVGDGSGLTGLVGASADRIISGTAQVIANGNSNSISITEAGVTTGYFYGGKLVAGGVSTTGIVSATGLYVTNTALFSGLVGMGTNAPSGTLHIFDGTLNFGSSNSSANKRTFMQESADAFYLGSAPANQNLFLGQSSGGARGFSGIYYDTNGNVGGGGHFLRIGGIPMLYVTSNSNVAMVGIGISASTPSGTLHVYGGVSSSNIYLSRAGSPATQGVIDYSGSSMVVGTNGADGLVLRTNGTTRFSVDSTGYFSAGGNMGIGGMIGYIPSTTLHVSGTLRIANGGEACDNNRSGAIRYASSSFDFCDGGGTWKSLATMAAAGAATPDRIISGTTSIIANNGGGISVSLPAANVFEVRSALGGSRLTIAGATNYANNLRFVDGLTQKASLDFTPFGAGDNLGMTTSLSSLQLTNTSATGFIGFYTGAGSTERVRIDSSGNVGIGTAYPSQKLTIFDSSNASISFRSGAGTPGPIREARISAVSTGGGGNGHSLAFLTNLSGASPTEGMRLTSDGLLGLGTATPTAPLEVSGTISATVLQLANSPANTCGPSTYGSMKMINGRPYYCRQ
ncbi:hypothetical protein [Mesorhizobium jarvisii]|uniref:hypothetical protein n=1 Tax=Mesorhizobium jarvisii TaxID=1777867 RepID=UPI0011C3C746|nr:MULTISPECIES: hypothetical protein [Mesorhizobium]